MLPEFKVSVLKSEINELKSIRNQDPDFTENNGSEGLFQLIEEAEAKLKQKKTDTEELDRLLSSTAEFLNNHQENKKKRRKQKRSDLIKKFKF